MNIILIWIIVQIKEKKIRVSNKLIYSKYQNVKNEEIMQEQKEKIIANFNSQELYQEGNNCIY